MDNERFRPSGDLFSSEQIDGMAFASNFENNLTLEEARVFSESDGMYVSVMHTQNGEFVKVPFPEDEYQEALKSGLIKF